MQKVKLAIYGGGGFGREIACWVEELTRLGKQHEFVGFIDDSPTIHQRINGFSVFTFARFTETCSGARVAISVANPRGREELAAKVRKAGLGVETLVHPSVIRSQHVSLGVGSIICAACVLTTDIVLGDHVQVNVHSTIGHDVTMGDCTTIGPGVHIAGCVTIGKRVFIGAGAVIINGTLSEPLTIGDDSVIGAGSCVIRSLSSGSHVFGNPARPYIAAP